MTIVKAKSILVLIFKKKLDTVMILNAALYKSYGRKNL